MSGSVILILAGSLKDKVVLKDCDKPLPGYYMSLFILCQRITQPKHFRVLQHIC